MEIIGLLIIVVLVVIIFFFLLSFTLGKHQPTPKSKIQHDEYATRFVEAIYTLDTPCGARMDNYIKDCILHKPTMCQGKNACAYVNDVTRTILTKTLASWGEPYLFNISKTPIHHAYGNCTGTSEAWRVGEQLISIPLSQQQYDTAVISLRLCKN